MCMQETIGQRMQRWEDLNVRMNLHGRVRVYDTPFVRVALCARMDDMYVYADIFVY